MNMSLCQHEVQCIFTLFSAKAAGHMIPSVFVLLSTREDKEKRIFQPKSASIPPVAFYPDPRRTFWYITGKRHDKALGITTSTQIAAQEKNKGSVNRVDDV